MTEVVKLSSSQVPMKGEREKTMFIKKWEAVSAWCSVASVSDSATLMDCSPPGSSVPGILQARILEPLPPSGDPLHPGIKPMSLTSPAWAGRFFTTSATWEKAMLQPKVSQNGLVVMELWNSRAPYSDADHFSRSFLCCQARPLLLHSVSKYWWTPTTHQALFWVLGMFTKCILISAQMH